jgi:hypothetical protein
MNLSVVLICISLMTKDVGYFFHIFIGHLYFLNCLFSSFDHILIGLFVLLEFNILCSLCILDVNSLLDEWLGEIFSHYVGCPFMLVIVSFAVQKLFNLI